MRPSRSIRAAGALAVLALAVPATASAVPSVTSVEAKTGNPGVTFLTDPTGAGLTNTQTRYVLSLDGWVLGYVEDNGVAAGGVLDYSALPSEYREPMTAQEKLAYPAAQTGLQAHATCSGVASLTDPDTVLAWQSGAREPSYAYVPFQKTSAGLGDDPATWIAVVKRATGVDLATVTDPRAECERLGGRLEAADSSTPLANALVAAATAPLQTQLADLRRAKDAVDRSLADTRTSLTTTRDALTAARTALTTARDALRAADAAYQALFLRPIDLSLATRRFQLGDGVALVTGVATDPVTLTVDVPRGQRRALGLSSTTIVEATGEINAEGALLVRLVPDRAIARKLRRALTKRRTIPLVIYAESGATNDTVRATLTR
ncbi:hypothetical protein Q5424_26675 [Conexibacter sp. JD483]|uniref:hypothetical protein n=1 Tax=unclassified Conexibacter TaxID=2627773 RepID=UPI002716EEE6|nr:MULTISPECIES: hypothetical protein [unclassified Conexibacter]MDO8187776.1 hypothetical protein [Conexibacter sp. CPCC 205706]MDO8201385.1 hypothetical protein [Conexibacter sp. CPCC 205762]MDR9372713.1 hypothetical protein [Conexibacter sp. JD483]